MDFNAVISCICSCVPLFLLERICLEAEFQFNPDKSMSQRLFLGCLCRDRCKCKLNVLHFTELFAYYLIDVEIIAQRQPAGRKRRTLLSVA
jgi:hypothetical protein